MREMNMFETHISQEYVISEDLAQENIQLWKTMQLSLIQPWLFVISTCQFQSGEKERSHMFLGHYKQLVSMAEDPDRNVGFIMLASPGHINQSGSWKFNELTEIWEGVECECEQTGVVYVLKDGSRLTNSLHNDEKTLLNLHRVYPPQ